MVSTDTAISITEIEPKAYLHARAWEYPLWNSSMEYGRIILSRI